ncbi:hydrogenase nickel incorporation protein HypB [Breoghania sp.]|uniref:hydrogenase nickel incorporation protein HypB n=1 Tax=Breoghania sp. TaxID=2065378 RepID=UPI00263132EB|nr:hydrogenase nickel incorporation protein HypB [Breoghania sp.]MDJ0931249.1 hydrogenase nickel incorporation protein HypB [Breoghania sp.]
MSEEEHAALHAAGIAHGHDHEHTHKHTHEDRHIHYGEGEAGISVPGLDQTRVTKMEEAVLGENDRRTAENRAVFEKDGMLALNLLSSPGSGKTTLLCETVKALQPDLPVAVIEGDQQTSNDADHIRETSVSAIQVNTGKECHLDAAMIADASKSLNPQEGSVLFIENVGNLVFPATFDLGEAAKVVILSVTEGEDKPIKYPDMFAVADLMIINKIDLAPYVKFDIARCMGLARRVNPSLQILQLSATSGEGLEIWVEWVRERRAGLIASRAA